jgi:hypothetical protein
MNHIKGRNWQRGGKKKTSNWIAGSDMRRESSECYNTICLDIVSHSLNLDVCVFNLSPKNERPYNTTYVPKRYRLVDDH